MWWCYTNVLVGLVGLLHVSEAAWGTILNTTELVAKEGYHSERHVVESQDGFRITVFRIPGGGTPVLFMHGLFVASDSWVLRGKNLDLVYLLADLGYDIWMGDARGNCYSRSHNTFKPEDSVFWDFSFDEMGSLDLPAMIDHILNTTGHQSLIYVGHSLGTTMMYVMSSRRPEYVYKVRLMVGLTPAAFFGHYTAAFQRFFLESSSSYSSYFGRAGVHEILPRTPLLGSTAKLFCSKESPTQPLCLQFMYFTAGFGSLSDFSRINKTRLPDYMSHLLTGTSPKNLAHLGQLSKSGRFTNYDYGLVENMERYGTPSPPDYDLSKTSMPVVNFYAESDTFVDPKDAIKLSENLPNLVANTAVANPLFNHMDFLWSEDAKELVYEQVIQAIEKYSQ